MSCTRIRACPMQCAEFPCGRRTRGSAGARYVKPFVKRQKNDAIDAEAICEAAQRPSMRFVAVKIEQQQAAGLVFSDP